MVRSGTERQREITTRDLLNVFEQRQAAARNRQRIVDGSVEDLAHYKMRCILLDPPWRKRGSALPYETITLDELARLPIPGSPRP